MRTAPSLRSTGLAGAVRSVPLLVAVLAASCATTVENQSVDRLIAGADYGGALALAIDRAAERPNDAAAQRDLVRARVALYLDRARRANFEGDFERSLAYLEEAESLWPGQPDVGAWHKKSTDQLAASLRQEAREAETSGDFELAYARFEEADRLDPHGPQAGVGAERVLLRANHREGLGDAYYTKGIRALREYRAAEAVQALDAAIKYAPGDPRFTDRRSEAAALLAEERLRIAEELEKQGLFRAARNEYRLALLIVEDLPAAHAGLERTTTEVQALDFLEEADRALILDDFGRAMARVERAAALSTLQADAVEAKRDEVREAELAHLYETAREFESDYDFLPAIAAYERLLERADGFYDDAISRRDTLESYIELAGQFYERANQASTEKEQLDYLRRISLIWPTYRDVAKRLAALEAN